MSNLRLIHDRNPINILSALRNVVSEPNIAWYTRSLEIWEVRRNFSTWKSPVFDKGKPAEDLDSDEHRKWPEQHHDYSHLGLSCFDDDELDQYHGFLLHTLRLSEVRAQVWMNRLESGYDEPLKLLLMALLPRLNKITFMGFNTWRNNVPANHNPLRLFSASLRNLALLPALQWPCFQSLKEVTLGQTLNLRLKNEKYYPTPYTIRPMSYTIAPLLLLAAIQNLTLNSLPHADCDVDSKPEDENDPEDDSDCAYWEWKWEWKYHISTCQDLQFNDCLYGFETVTNLFAGIKALRSFTSVGGSSDQRGIVVSLLKNAKFSLEVLRLDGGNELYDMRILKGFENLRRPEVVDRLLIDPTTYKPTRSDVHRSSDRGRRTFGVADWIDFVASLPSTLETLTIYFQHQRFFEHETQGLLEQLSLLVAAKSSDQFSNLSGICIGNILFQIPYQHDLPPIVGGPMMMRPVNVSRWCFDLRKACDAKGILLHSNPPDDPDSDATCPSCPLYPSVDGTESLPKKEEKRR